MSEGGVGRLQSLDVFRGATIAAMLLVNNPGTWSAIYPPLRHAPWHGWTPTDLIFPFFLFIVGVAMTFSFGARLEGGADRRALMWKAAKRAGILFALGLLLHSFPWIGYDFGQLRIPGVLQRIALAYLAATPLVLWLGPRARAATVAALLLGYWALLALVPVPGSGAGVLEPGQDLGAWIDRVVFGEGHLWAQTRTWDPEGLLGTIPAVATVLLGVFAGQWLRGGASGRAPRRGALPGGMAPEKAQGLLVGGAAAIAVGLLWGLVFPINKPLWTSSYVVFTAGMAAVLLAGCYWVVDVRGRRRGTRPFVWFGRNAIAAFFLSGIMARLLGMIRVSGGDGTVSLKAWLYQHAFGSWLAPMNASLAFALSFVLVWTVIVWAMHRQGVLIKV